MATTTPTRPPVFNLPNQLTASRFFLAIVLFVLIEVKAWRVGLGIVVGLFLSRMSFPPALGGGKDGGKVDPSKQVNGPKPPGCR